MSKIRPFSNGSSAMIWYSENCDLCVKAYHPKDGNYPSDATMKNYCSIGKECRFKYAIDVAFITGEIDEELAQKIGLDKGGNCLLFSDDKNDGYTPPKKPKPDNTPDNQILLFSEFDELVNTPVKELTL